AGSVVGALGPLAGGGALGGGRFGQRAGADVVQLGPHALHQEVQDRPDEGDGEEPEQPWGDRVLVDLGLREQEDGVHAFHVLTDVRMPANRSVSGSSVSTSDRARW